MEILNLKIEKMLLKGLVISLDFKGQNCLIFKEKNGIKTIYQERAGISEEVENTYSNSCFDSVLKIVLREKLGCCNSNPFIEKLMNEIIENKKLSFYKEC